MCVIYNIQYTILLNDFLISVSLIYEHTDLYIYNIYIIRDSPCISESFSCIAIPSSYSAGSSILFGDGVPLPRLPEGKHEVYQSPEAVHTLFDHLGTYPLVN